MNRLTGLLSVFMLGTVVFTGCKKDNDPAPTPPNYQPTTANSSWSFNVHNKVNAANSYNFTLRATAKDTTAAGKTFRVFSNTSGANEYYTQVGNSYFQFGGFAGLTSAVDLNYLRADVAPGGTWEETKTVNVNGIPASVTFKYTLVEKLSSYVVNTTTFNNVMHVKVDLTVPGLNITSQDLHFYYADGVGRVKSMIKLVAPFIGVNIDTETTLTAYTIVP